MYNDLLMEMYCTGIATWQVLFGFEKNKQQVSSSTAVLMFSLLTMRGFSPSIIRLLIQTTADYYF